MAHPLRYDELGHIVRALFVGLCRRQNISQGIVGLCGEAIPLQNGQQPGQRLRGAKPFFHGGPGDDGHTDGDPLPVEQGEAVASLYGVAHGVANGILLAPVMEYNKDFTGEKYRDIADAFGVEDAYTGDLEKVREEAVQAVHKLTVDLKNPTTISEVGATEADLEPLAHDAFNDVCTPGNPRQATEEDILAIYKSLM